MAASVSSDSSASAKEVDAFLSSHAGKGNTERTYAGALRQVVWYGTDGAISDPRQFDFRTLDASMVKAVQNKGLADGKRPATINLWILAAKGVLERHLQAGDIPLEQFYGVEQVARLPEQETHQGVKAASHEVVAALYRVLAADPSFLGRRDEALITLFFGAGLWIGEATQLRIEDFDAREGTLSVPAARSTTRVAYLSSSAQDALTRYAQERGDGPGFFIIPGYAQGKGTNERPMSPPAIRHALQNRCLTAGAPPVTPENLRQAFVDYLEQAQHTLARQWQVPFIRQEAAS